MSRAEGRVLNLGCGFDIMLDAVNHDKVAREGVDCVWDLNDLPWPWETESFDYVVAKSVLGYLDIDLLTALNEIWRILTPGGVIQLTLAYWKAEANHDDPTFRRGYGLGVCDRLDPESKHGKRRTFYTPCGWKMLYRPVLNKAKTTLSCRLEARK